MKDVAILRPLQNEKFLRLPAAVATQTGTRGCPRRHQKFFVFFGHFIVREVISSPFPISKLIAQNSKPDTEDLD